MNVYITENTEYIKEIQKSFSSVYCIATRYMKDGVEQKRCKDTGNGIWLKRFHSGELFKRTIPCDKVGNPDLKVKNKFWTRKRTIYFDVDFHCSSNNPDDARRLFNEVVIPLFKICSPNYSSTSGSAWLTVDHKAGEIKDWNQMIDNLDAWLKDKAKSLALNLSEVAVRGKVDAPQFDEWVAINTVAKTVVVGQFFKCPDRLEWFKHVVPFSSLSFIPTAPVKDKPKRMLKLVDLPAQPMQVMNLSDITGAVIKKIEPVFKASIEASWSPCLVPHEDIQNIWKLERVLRNDPSVPRCTEDGKRKIKTKQVAEVVLVIKNMKPNPDGTMPFERTKALINAIWQAGDFRYAPVNEVISTIRNWLSKNGNLVWLKNSYSVAMHKACKWSMDIRCVQKINKILNSNAEKKDEVQTVYMGGDTLFHNFSWNQHMKPTHVEFYMWFDPQEMTMPAFETIETMKKAA